MAAKPADLGEIDVRPVAKGAATPLASAAATASVVEPLPPAPKPTFRAAAEPSTAATFRLPVSLQERLREAAHQLRTTKTDIVEAALDAYLKGESF